MSKVDIVFWNLGKRDLTDSLQDLCRLCDADLVVLAEPSNTPMKIRSDLADALALPVTYVNQPGQPDKTHLLSLRTDRFVHARVTSASGRLSIFEVDYPDFPRFMLASVHLVSKRNSSDATILEEARMTMEEIRQFLSRVGTDRFVVCGDFNMNPFDEGMISASAFHGVLDKTVAGRKSRTIQGREYRMLYNPMWSLLGDYPQGPPGTFYHSPSEHATTHWHMLDQFLVSPELLESVTVDLVEVVASDGNRGFLTPRGSIDPLLCSDHLPIHMRLRVKS